MEDVAVRNRESSIEDILSKALFVNNVTDPLLVVDQLNDIFHEVIFAFAEEDDDDDEESREMRVVLTAREKRRKEKERRKLQREVSELNDTTDVNDEEEDEEDFASEESSAEMNEIDEDFYDWIRVDQKQPTTRDTEIDEERGDVELDLERVGLGKGQQDDLAGQLPDRFGEIEKREERPRLQGKSLPGGQRYEISLESEAYWILRQLRNAGQPLAHNTRICALASHSLRTILDDPVMVSLTFALQKMTREFLEPAHLMMYYQSQLHPLLFALFEDSALQDAARHNLPMTSYAYSTVTGSRQLPYLRETDIGFDTYADRPIGPEDPEWERDRRHRDADYCQRKPCFIELGRLLVRILDLDVLCHQLESRRHQMLLMLKSSTEALLQRQYDILSQMVFESSVDVDIWHSFVQSLVSRSPSKSARRIQELGLENDFEVYSLTALQYQENLFHGVARALCPSQPIRLREWAENVGKNLQRPASAESIISLFNGSIVEQFSRLPLLCKKVVDLFCTVGHLIVTYKLIKKPDSIYPLSSFAVEYPRHYLELLLLKSQGHVDLHYVLDEKYVREVLREDELYHVRPKSSATSEIEYEWYFEREQAFASVVAAVMDVVVPRVQAELRTQARYHTTKESIERLGTYCSEGPYQRTRLSLSAYSENYLLWEPEWNVVEALPVTEPDGAQLHERVCGISRGKSGLLTLAFIDEMGTLMMKAHWPEANMSTANGRAVEKRNQMQMMAMFEQCAPSVVAVAASDIESLNVMRRVQRFLKECIYAQLETYIPVVWCCADVPRFFSESSFAMAEGELMDPAVRMSVGVGRYVQDPLNVIATLFDSKKTALHLFCSSFQYQSKDQKQQLYASLCWEMSLWVGAVGFWLEDCVRRPSSAAVLQFVPGMGLSKAKSFIQKVSNANFSSRTSLKQTLTEEFSCFIAENAAPCIRVRPSDVAQGGDWHPLDQSLIPLEEYSVASFVAALATHNSDANRNAWELSLIDFLTSGTIMDRRGCINRYVSDGKRVAEDARDRNIAGVSRITGAREIDFIADELIANGVSFMRRPYRMMTTKALMLCLTGIAYLSHEDSTNLDSPILNKKVIIQEGSFISGTIDGFRAGKNAGIRLTTSRGLRAFIPISEIPDEHVRHEVEQRVAALEKHRARRREADDVFGPQTDYLPPEWLQRDAVIQGTVQHCNWTQCELWLRWCDRSTDVIDNKDDGDHYVSYADIARDGVSSANTIRTAQIVQDAHIFSKKVAEHPLFRVVSNTQAMDLLRDKEIGEVLFRPSSQSKRKIVCMVKLGVAVTCNLVISEDRRGDGSIYYSFEDTVVGEKREFDGVDEFLQKYIAPMVSRVHNLRGHRKFVEHMHDVPSSLAEQQHGTHSFAYVFVENTKKLTPPLYRVFTRGGGKEHRFHIHFNDNGIYVRLPVVENSPTKKVYYAWVKCTHSEDLSEALKEHALRNSGV